MKLIKRQIFVVLLLGFWAALHFGQAITQPNTTLITEQIDVTENNTLEQKLQDEIEQLNLSENYLKNLQNQASSVEVKQLETEDIEQAAFNVSLAEVQIEKISLTLSSAQKDYREIQSDIEQYEKQLISAHGHQGDETIPLIENHLNVERKKLEIESERINVLKQWLIVANDILYLEQQYLKSMTDKARVKQVESLLAMQQKTESDVIKQQQQWEEKLKELRMELDETRPIESPATPKQRKLQDEILEAEEKVQVLKIQLNLSRIDTLVEAYQSQDISEESAQSYIEFKEYLTKLRDELVANDIAIGNKLILLQRQIDILEEPGASYVYTREDSRRMTNILEDLKSSYEDLNQQINELMTVIANLQNELLSGVAQTWKTRQKIPITLQEWEIFGKDLWVLPQVAYQSVRATYNQLVENLSYATSSRWGLTFGFIMAWSMFWIWIGRILNQFLQGAREEGLSFSANTLVMFAQLIYRNIMGITVFGSLMILLILLNVSSNLLIIPLSLGAVWFLYKIAIGLARMYLFENIWDLSGEDVKLYNGLRWTLGLGSIIIAFTVLAHQLPIPSDTVASFDRMFMLVLLAVSIPLLKNWRVLPSIFVKEDRIKPYVSKVVYWLGFLIPLIIFSNAIIGLVGYVALAWKMWIVEALFLMVLTAWLLAKGIIGDIMEGFAKISVRRLKSGWVWTESILKPTHTVINIALFIMSLWLLFILYGFDQNPVVMEKLISARTHTIFELGNTEITVINIIQFIVLLIVIRWAAKWSREFSFRFLFAKHKDKGIRNSLSVFTQYAIVIIGAFIILKVVGIDLTTITVVLGALAVGIGFGLQNIANNLVSGILLLVERPFREGDIITLGESEGEVTHIGMRATTIKTWDNMDIIIPNAETVSRSLKNWTHQDVIVRTTFLLRTSFVENPRQVHALIMQTVRMHENVVKDPEPTVVLQEFGESALIFQVRYFINISEGEIRPMVKSELLMRLWEVLRAAGIEIPYNRSIVNLNDDRSE